MIRIEVVRNDIFGQARQELQFDFTISTSQALDSVQKEGVMDASLRCARSCCEHLRVSCLWKRTLRRFCQSSTKCKLRNSQTSVWELKHGPAAVMEHSARARGRGPAALALQSALLEIHIFDRSRLSRHRNRSQCQKTCRLISSNHENVHFYVVVIVSHAKATTSA